MNWNAFSAIGTTVAAAVGIIGLLLNLYDKIRGLSICFQSQPSFKIFISNMSLRSVYITKINCSVKKDIFYEKCFEGPEAMCLPPATAQCILLDNKELLKNYCEVSLNVLCENDDESEIKITVFDNYNRKYKIKEHVLIKMLYD